MSITSIFYCGYTKVNYPKYPFVFPVIKRGIYIITLQKYPWCFPPPPTPLPIFWKPRKLFLSDILRPHIFFRETSTTRNNLTVFRNSHKHFFSIDVIPLDIKYCLVCLLCTVVSLGVDFKNNQTTKQLNNFI